MTETYTLTKFEDTWEARSISLNNGDLRVVPYAPHQHALSIEKYYDQYGIITWGFRKSYVSSLGNYINPKSHKFSNGVFDIEELSYFGRFVVALDTLDTTNHGWTTVTVNGIPFNRVDAWYFGINAGKPRWIIDSDVNPFEETIGSIATVNWII